MRGIVPRLYALIEVSVVFGLAALAFRMVYASPLGIWEHEILQRPFLEYVAVMAIPLAALALTRRDFAAYGIALRNLKPQLDVAAIGFLPIAALALVLNVVNWQRWQGALFVLALEAALLPALAWLVRNKPTAGGAAPASVTTLLLLVPSLAQAQASAGALLSLAIFNFIFAAPAEEILFRGYLQSRLGAVCRPYHFLGVPWGWGVVASALLFAAWHIIAPLALRGTYELAWPHGMWTFGAGLLFSFARAKTGGIAAPALLHGVLNVF